ncbi:MAG: DNA integrity scanning protein DisA nucleotide-binding domain protein [Candidatus Pacearchaeota archaeon]|jgi:DNA integrity scanning protein DisA with diadenylate cyclase activity
MSNKNKGKFKMTKNMKKLEELLIQVGLRIAKRGEGALFVIGDVEYKPLIEQQVPPFNALNNPKLLESLALMDGAVILDKSGYVKAYGVMIKSRKAFKNFGTRHSAGLSASYGENLVVIISEEDRKIRILKDGKMVMQIDALQKNVEKSVPEAVNILESLGAGTVGTIGTSLLVPTLGIAFLPGIVMFGSAYYLIKHIGKYINFKR